MDLSQLPGNNILQGNLLLLQCQNEFLQWILRTSEVLEYGRQFAKPVQHHLLILAEQCWEIFLSLIQKEVSNRSLPYRGVLEQRHSFQKYSLSRCSFSCLFSSGISFKFKILFWIYCDQIKLIQKNKAENKDNLVHARILWMTMKREESRREADTCDTRTNVSFGIVMKNKSAFLLYAYWQKYYF